MRKYEFQCYLDQRPDDIVISADAKDALISVSINNEQDAVHVDVSDKPDGMSKADILAEVIRVLNSAYGIRFHEDHDINLLTRRLFVMALEAELHKQIKNNLHKVKGLMEDVITATGV